MSPKRVLLAAHPTVGHTQALRALGVELRARGHVVAFALPQVPQLPRWLPAPEALRAAQHVVSGVAHQGFDWIPTPFTRRAALAAGRIEGKRGYDELAIAAELFTAGMVDTAHQLGREITQRQVDVVVHDFAFLGAWLAAEARRRPSAAIFHSGLPFPAPNAAPFGSGLELPAAPAALAHAEERLADIMAFFDRRIAKARKTLALPPVPAGMLTRPYSRGVNVLTTHPAFELPRPNLEASAAGPLLWAGVCSADAPAGLQAFPWERLTHTKPLVYISLGTVFNNQPRLFRALLRAVHDAGACAVVAAGASFKRVRGWAAADDVVVRFAPQRALLDRAQLVIGHGGNNSTNETLQAGKPLLVLPFGAEQIANGQRVEGLGVGTLLREPDLAPKRLAGIVRAALQPALAERARALAASVPTQDGVSLIADAVEVELVAGE